jgi:hypothetical protein
MVPKKTDAFCALNEKKICGTKQNIIFKGDHTLSLQMSAIHR